LHARSLTALTLSMVGCALETGEAAPEPGEVSERSSQGFSHGNWFTRLDTQSRYDVHTWLQDQLTDEPEQGTNPCAGLCSAPTSFTGALNVSSFGSGESCYESTTSTLGAGAAAASRAAATSRSTKPRSRARAASRCRPSATAATA
jgi:hypothetical protein